MKGEKMEGKFNYKNNLDDETLKQLVKESFSDAPSMSDVDDEWNRFKGKYIIKRKRHNILTIVAAASVCSIAIILSLFIYSPDKSDIVVFEVVNNIDKVAIYENNGNVYVTTPAAKQTKIAMEDGSVVCLDANSNLVYPKHFTGDKREVFLKGRARFSVKSDSVHPFIVIADNLSVYALGTVFDVKSYGCDNPMVALFKGKVKVLESTSKKQCLLTPGESVLVDVKNNMAFEKIATDISMGWAEKEFVFDNTSLFNAMKEIGAWYNVGIRCSDFELLDKRIYFHISRNVGLDVVLKMLNDMNIASFGTKNGQILIQENK